jgi:thymidylate synthase
MLRIETSPDGKMFIGAGVIRDAHCGSTWFVAKNSVGQIFQDMKKPFQVHIHIPVLEVWTKILKSGILSLHKAGYIIREAVENGIECEK